MLIEQRSDEFAGPVRKVVQKDSYICYRCVATVISGVSRQTFHACHTFASFFRHLDSAHGREGMSCHFCLSQQSAHRASLICCCVKICAMRSQFQVFETLLRSLFQSSQILEHMCMRSDGQFQEQLDVHCVSLFVARARSI